MELFSGVELNVANMSSPRMKEEKYDGYLDFIQTNFAITVNKGKETLRCAQNGFELEVIRSENDPAAEDEAKVDEKGAEEEAHALWQCPLQCE